MRINIYTDGACSGNPGPGGWAAVIILPENLTDNNIIKISDGVKNATNNQMELLAVIEALNYTYETILYIENATNTIIKNLHIDIYSDSAYVVNAINENWLKKWQLNGWKTKTNNNIKNHELWIKLHKLLKIFASLNYRINFIKIKGHSGNYYNELVDKLAKREINSQKGSK